MIAHRRARAATAAVRQQRHVSARLKILNFAMRGKNSKFYEMISAAARAELRPRLILVLLRDRADRPIRVQHAVRAAFLEIRANAEARLRLDGAREAIQLLLQVTH